MKPEVITSTQKAGNLHAPKFTEVLDGRKQPIRGLWIRNGQFVARIATEDEDGMTRTWWVPLEGAETVAQAQAARLNFGPSVVPLP